MLDFSLPSPCRRGAGGEVPVAGAGTLYSNLGQHRKAGAPALARLGRLPVLRRFASSRFTGLSRLDALGILSLERLCSAGMKETPWSPLV